MRINFSLRSMPAKLKSSMQYSQVFVSADQIEFTLPLHERQSVELNRECRDFEEETFNQMVKPHEYYGNCFFIGIFFLSRFHSSVGCWISYLSYGRSIFYLVGCAGFDMNRILLFLYFLLLLYYFDNIGVCDYTLSLVIFGTHSKYARSYIYIVFWFKFCFSLFTATFSQQHNVRIHIVPAWDEVSCEKRDTSWIKLPFETRWKSNIKRSWSSWIINCIRIKMEGIHKCRANFPFIFKHFNA